MVLKIFEKYRDGGDLPLRQQLARAESALAAVRAEHERLTMRFDLIRLATSDGLWDMEVGQFDLTDPNNPFWWSDQFRRLLGFQDEHEFPNVLGSWSSRLHPDDVAPTLAAFAAHIDDRSGRTPYDPSYRLRCRNDQYRWFRALGHTIRAADGTPLRVAGALTDITDRNALLGMQRYAEDIIGSLPTGLMIVDDGLRVLMVNRSFRDIFGLKHADDIVGGQFQTVLPQPGMELQARAVLADASTRRGIEVTFGAKRLRMALAGIVLADGGRRLLVMVEDMTAEHQLREQARAHAARHRDQASLLDKARDAIIVRGIDGRVQFWNKGAERLYGWSAQEVLGEAVDRLLYVDTGAFAAASRVTLAAGEWSGQVAQRCKDGREVMVEGHWTLVRDDENEPKSILVINTDITERKVTEEKIRNLALYDSLTGLPNRRLFLDRLRLALAGAERNGRALALLFMDLNRFKEINDTLGHGTGDQVLIKVARRFQAALRGKETLARLAGDEFVVLVEIGDQGNAVSIAQRLQQSLAEPIAAGTHTFSVGVSIGIASYPADAVTIEDLLKRADIAMYRAKASGGGHRFYQPEMSVGLAERMEMAKDLGHALNAGKLELYYQPQVSLVSGAVIGAETLLRWNDPQRGWVSPSKFIPIAEARGMIGALGTWVLGQACRQLKAWRQDGLRFPGRLSVNLAAQQLEQVDIAESIQAVVSAAGLTPDCLALELTESGLMGNVERAIGIMQTLKSAGFSIAIDDFGTGYSSLAYLKRLPADKLKIDISFVRDMLHDGHDYTIVTTIIGMARNLGLGVIAEGVEESGQAEALLALGCDEAQGYFFGHPESADSFARKWLAAVPA